jgi:hypothetical protein
VLVHNHYERSFAAMLRHRGITHVPVEEKRRSVIDGTPVKSLDFLVLGEGGRWFVTDVKGRRFPGGPPGKPRRVLECWSTLDDVDGLERWANRFGGGCEGLLVFPYLVDPQITEECGWGDAWEHEGRHYRVLAVRVTEYRQHMRVRSPRWGTVDLPAAAYRSLVRPLSYFTGAGEPWLLPA